MTTRTEAVDIMMGHVEAARAAAATLQDPITVVWPDVPNVGGPPSGQSWIRPAVNHNFGRQSTLSTDIGTRRFSHSGFLSIEIYAPIGDGGSLKDTIAQKFIGYFENLKNYQVWYRNIRALDSGKDGAYVSALFMADFEYDDFQ